MERLRCLADGKTIVNLFTEFNHATLDAIAQIAFGMDVDSINQKDPKLSQALSSILKTMQANIKERPTFKYNPKNRKVSEIKNQVALLL